MAQLAHDFEGTPDAATVVVGVGGNSNTAGNNYFNASSVGAGSSLEYFSSPVIEGNRHLRMRTGSGGSAFVSWQAARSLITDDFTRFLIREDAEHSGNLGIFKWYDSDAGTNAMGTLEYLAGGKLGIRNSAGSLVNLTGTGTISSATELAVNATYRIEVKHHADTTNGQLTVRIYSDPLESIPNFTEEFSAAAVFAMAATQTKRVDWGLAVAGANQPTLTTSEYIRMDAVINSAPDWIGPVVTKRPIRLVRGGLRW